MAELDEVATVRVEGETDPGVDAAIAKLNAVSDAQTRVGASAEASATVQERSVARSLSVSGAYERLRASLDASYQSQVKFGQGVSVLDQAFSQGIINQATYADRMTELHGKYGAVAQDATQAGGSAGRLNGLSGRPTEHVGPTNQTLTAFP